MNLDSHKVHLWKYNISRQTMQIALPSQKVRVNLPHKRTSYSNLAIQSSFIFNSITILKGTREMQFENIHRTSNQVRRLNTFSNQNQNSISAVNNKSIVTGALIGIVGLCVIPIIPVLIALLVGHWLGSNKQS